jgi:uncharacterized RDD family membrane protein YckC
MTESRPSGIDLLVDANLYAYDPAINPELFEGVLSRRVVAFLIDLLIIAAPILLAALFIFLFGVFTLGSGWMLFWLLGPMSAIWLLVYYGITMGGPASATIGMRTVGLEMRTWYGEPCYWELGAVHGLLFWVLISALTPLVLVFGLFNKRHQLLHDFLVGTVVIKVE